MSLCCPPGRGCNAPTGGEPCVLGLCRELATRDSTAATAVARWEQLQQALRDGVGGRDVRFRRRSYERARERALVALLMRAHAPAGRRRARAHGGEVAHPTTRLGVLLGYHRRGFS